MKSLALAAVLLLCGSAFAQAKTSPSAYHVGKLALITPHQAYDWQVHYTSANGSVDAYCDSTTYETNCTDSPAGAHYEVELEGDDNTHEHMLHTLTAVAVFVNGKQIKLHPDFIGRIDEDYDALAHGKEQLDKLEAGKSVSEREQRGASVAELTFRYRLLTLKLSQVDAHWSNETDKDIDIDVYCVPFTLRQTKEKKEIEKSVETCYKLYM